MRIAFITQEDPLYILPFFEEFFRHYGQDFSIVSVSSAPMMGARSRSQMVRELIALYGVIGFARLVTEKLAAGLRSRRTLNRGSTRFYSLKQLCAAYRIPYCGIGNPNKDGFRDQLEAASPDVLVSVACPYILKQPLLSVPLLGCINIHHAPLPYYKGMMPTFWQMYHGEPAVGVTVHLMAPKLDEGDAIVQEQLERMPGETLHALIRRSKRNGAHVMAKALNLLESGDYPRIPIGGKQGSYFTFPDSRQIAEFRYRGLRAI